VNICLLGFTDKRPAIYSLIKVLGQVGRTLLISPNIQFTQLSEEYEQNFEVMGVHIICEPISFGEILSEIDIEEFNYIIFDCMVEVPEMIDVALIQDNLEYYRELLDGTDEDAFKLFINKELTAEKGNTYAMVSAATLESTCRKIENAKLPYPFPSSGHNKLMSALLSQILQMPQQNILKFLKKGVK
jgi:hypothetical protein